MPLSVAQYTSVFVESGLVSEEDFLRAKIDAESSNPPRSVEAIFVETGVLTDEQAGKLLADAYETKFVDASRIKVDREAARIIPELVAKRQFAFAYGWTEGRLQVVMVDPHNTEFVGFLEKKTGHEVDVAYTTPNLLSGALMSYTEDTLARAVAAAELFESRRKEGTAPAMSTGKDNEDLVVSVVDALMKYGFDNNASDIHVEPHEKTTMVRYRLDGILHDAVKLPKSLHELVVARVKIMSNLRTDEHFAAQDGKFRMKMGTLPLDVRVSILPIVEGEKIVMRLLSEKGRALTLETLGFAPADLAKVRRAAEKPYGMLLATGPTGSGKTTSMYAVLKILNKRDVNIQTIEDPVEYDVEGVNQIQVNTRTNLTFAAGLRSIVRQDPDIIMVGEIRDAETAGIAVNAAMTGHLVLSTLHTNDAATAIPRLFDMEVEPFLIASSVNLIIAQRLVRRICGSCVSSVQTDLTRLKESLEPELYKRYFGTKSTGRTFKGKGCVACHESGYAGRLGLYEILEVSDAIRGLIMKRANAGDIEARAMADGMTTMLEDGLRKVTEGVTTVEEVLRVVKT